MIRRILIVAAIVGLAGLLAFPLRNVIYEVVVIPVSYLLWALGLFYHALPQVVWWFAIGIFIFYLFMKSILPEVRLPRKRDQYTTPPKGQVEHLSDWMHKAESGVYNRWLVANRLGRLAYQILLQRDSGHTRSFFAPLEGPDWNASLKLTDYLHAGLHGSFADYPKQSNPFKPPMKTPLDHDLHDAVDFLETKIDTTIR